jgi:hypothetical protein
VRKGRDDAREIVHIELLAREQMWRRFKQTDDLALTLYYSRNDVVTPTGREI